MTRDLVIVGAGGFARETAAAVRELGDTWRLLGFLDDDGALHGQYRQGVPILGGIDAVRELPTAGVVVCVGNPRDYAARSRSVEGFEAWLYRWVLGVKDRKEYLASIDLDSIRIKQHRPSVPADYGDQ